MNTGDHTANTFEQTAYFDDQALTALVKEHGAPLYVYSRAALEHFARQALGFACPYGTTVRFAVKANPYPDIMKLFDSMGLWFDASSGPEAEYVIKQGINTTHVALNSQELPPNLQQLVESGVEFTATSLHQVETYCKLFPNTSVAVRINPGIGSGESRKVTTGGVAAGFGIWHEYIPQVLAITQKSNVNIHKVHTHIGAGTDPVVWRQAAEITLDLVNQFPSAKVVSFGGGFKVGRMPDEPTADIAAIGKDIARSITQFADKTGRKLYVEIEPGTYLTALAGVLVASIIDSTDTGTEGYNFLRINTGMNDLLRPALYGAQHPLHIIGAKTTQPLQPYIVVGHNCESGDILTPAKGDPESIQPRLLPPATIGDLCVIGGAGAYCASMRAVGYNAFAPAKEIVI